MGIVNFPRILIATDNYSPWRIRSGVDRKMLADSFRRIDSASGSVPGGSDSYDTGRRISGALWTRPLCTCWNIKMSDSSQQKAASPETQQVKDGATSKDPPKKSKLTSIVTKEEIRRYVDLGLGRGVDATNPKPWLNKSSFQVRRVAIESVIGTEEGGALQSYEREITSVQTQQTDLKASIAVPRSPVNIGVDAEQSRSTSSRRRAVGKKVINRTISFRVGFEDAPSSSAAHLGSAREATAVSSSMGGAVFQSEAATFEERLTYWIMVRVQERRDLAAMKTGTEGSSTALDSPRVYSGNPVADLAEVILNSSVEERKAILKDCREFVNHFRITHYVSAIELGATEYRVLTETEYYHRVDLAGTLGIDLIGSAAVSEALSLKKSSRSSDLKRVGVVSDKGKVERGTYDEAVVGVALEPISSVVKLYYLRLALRKALLDYMQEQSDTSGKLGLYTHSLMAMVISYITLSE